jgi:hypothetical protein
MRKCNWIVVILAVVICAFMPRGVARAQTVSSYVNCSTGAPPYTPATVSPNSSQEVQAFCNPGDVALGGGYEVLNPPLPLPKGVLVITPENSFHFANTTADGWQVVLQNINLSPCACSPLRVTTLRPRLPTTARLWISESACPAQHLPPPSSPW